MPASTPPAARAVLAATLSLLVSSLPACATSADPGDGDDAPDGAAEITSISPTSGDPGTNVTIRATGFAPGGAVDIGFGPPSSEYEVMGEARADTNGDVITAADVPSWAETGRSYVFVVADVDNRPRAISSRFHVTTEEGNVRVTGRITDEGVECTALRSDGDNQLYTLAGDASGLEPGDRVTVEGTLAEMSYCQQGTTIDVEEFERRD